MKENIEIKIEDKNIRLDQLLKFSGLVSTGGEAKVLIFNQLVEVNKEICQQRGKKIKKGDIVNLYIENEDYQIKII